MYHFVYFKLVYILHKGILQMLFVAGATKFAIRQHTELLGMYMTQPYFLVVAQM